MNIYIRIDKSNTCVLPFIFPGYSSTERSRRAIIWTSLDKESCEALYTDCVIVCPYGQTLESDVLRDRLKRVGISLGVHHARKFPVSDNILQDFRDYLSDSEEETQLLDLITHIDEPDFNSIWCHRVAEYSLERVVSFMNAIIDGMFTKETAFYRKLRSKYAECVDLNLHNVSVQSQLIEWDTNDVFGIQYMNLYKRLWQM